jgi:hypothetical protein
MIRKAAKGFGILLILAGVLGFIPGITHNGYLFGLFRVNALHNLLHLVTGLALFWTGKTSAMGAKLFFQIFGFAYGAIALLGFHGGHKPVLGVLANNLPDSFLHLGVAVVFLYCGFLLRSK